MDIFCKIDTLLQNQIIHKTTHFFVLHDGYPLVEGHLLIIPKGHFDCILSAEKKHYKEYHALKQEITQFLVDVYRRPVVFEHGGVGQTILHAHLHMLPTQQSISAHIKKVGKVMVNKKAPYLYYEEEGYSRYYQPITSIEDGFLHTCFARALSRPLIGVMRAKDAKEWILEIKRKWKIWQQDQR